MAMTFVIWGEGEGVVSLIKNDDDSIAITGQEGGESL